MSEPQKVYVLRKSSRVLSFPLEKALESFQSALNEIPAEHRETAELSVSMRAEHGVIHPELSIYYHRKSTETAREPEVTADATKVTADAGPFAKLSFPEFRSRWLESREPPVSSLDPIMGFVGLAILLGAIFVPAVVGRGQLKAHIWEVVAGFVFVGGVVTVARRSNWSLGLLLFSCVFFFVSCSENFYLALD